MSNKRKLLVIGWDAADWKIINKLIDKGLMPTFENLIKQGVSGNITTLDPPFSPMLWTSIATGFYPDKHGILGFTEPDQNKIGVRPVSSSSRKTRAIWNILSHENLKTHVIGWWPSNPVEPINGFMISNLYQKAHKDPTKWKMPANTVHPKAYEKLFEYLRVHPSEITEEHILPFVHNAPKIDQNIDKRLNSIVKILAEAGTIQSATTWILDNAEWDFVAVYLDAIDHFCHGFMHYHSPKLSAISNEDFEMYQGVVESAYRFHDMMLEELLKQAGKDATVLLISDHGFHSDHNRPGLLPDEPASPALQHRDHGIFCIKGPDIKKNEKIHGVSLLDITPTILSLFNLPIGRDMDGKVLTDIYKDIPELNAIPSWENISGNFFTLDSEPVDDPKATQEAMSQLVELGYIEDPGDDVKKSVEYTIRETHYNLARVYMGSNRFEQAIPLLEDISSNYKEETRFSLRLINCYKETGEQEKALTLCDVQHQKIIDLINKYQTEYSEAKNQNPKEESEKQKQQKLFRRLKDAQKDLYRIDIVKSEVMLRLKRPNEALESLESLNDKLSGQRLIFEKLGNTYIQLKQFDKAKVSFEELLKCDPNSHIGYHGLAIVYLKTKMYVESIECSFKAIDLVYQYPLAHYHLALALLKLELYEDASNALENALILMPNFGKARNTLIELYENKLNNKALAENHKQFFLAKSVNKIVNNSEKTSDENESIKTLENPILIVSGLPRSGTSMMMQMLDKTGLEVFVDDKRPADKNNPRGYFEHDAVKRLATDQKWIPQAKNKVVKVVSHLLVHLPDRYNYKIIFMERDIDEIIHSQHKMLVNLGKVKEDTYSYKLASTFKENVLKMKSWSRRKHNIQILSINHFDVLNNPRIECEKIRDFLEVDLDIDAMISVIDKSLHRSKI